MASIGDLIAPGNDDAFTSESTRTGGLADLAPRYLELLTAAVTASLTTVSAAGALQVSPVWVGVEGEHILLNTKRGRLKDRNLRDNGVVALLFMNPANPYHWMSVDGRVVEIIDEDDPEQGHLATESIDDLAGLYLGERPYPMRDPRGGEVRVLYRVEPVRILTFGSP